jgi:Alpha-L-arabinofuranosidase B, catalytic
VKNWHAVGIAVALLGAGVIYGLTQPIGPVAVNGCVFLTPTPTDRQSVPYLCDATGRLRMAGLTPSTLLLDNLSVVPTAAYSTRKLRAAYAGSALRVYNKTTTLQTDIGFDGSNNLNATTLGTACLGASCSVVTWYDQSGNGNNAVVEASGDGTTVLADVVNAGTNRTLNGHVSVFYNGAGGDVTNGCLGAAITLAQPVTLGAVVDQLVFEGAHLTDRDSGSRLIVGFSSTQWTLYAGTVVNGGAWSTGVTYGAIGIVNGPNSSLFAGGTTQIPTGTDVSTNGVVPNQYVGCANGGVALNAYLPEWILFPVSLGTTDQNTLKASWTSYWGST